MMLQTINNTSYSHYTLHMNCFVQINKLKQHHFNHFYLILVHIIVLLEVFWIRL